ncbi:MAG: EAL domain-containing protein [Oceanospirillales bacterium]|nr:MAG: EAL domain-containing protein [Oceanospirillales bacterium]
MRPASFKVLIYLFVFLVVSSELSRFFTLQDYSLSVIWPPAGIFLAAVLVFGSRVLPVLIIAMIFWSQVFQSSSWSLSLLFSFGLALGSWLGAKAMQSASSDLTPTQQLIRLYLGGVLLASGISSLLGTVGIMLENPLDGYAFHDIWLVYWAFEAFGVMLFAPIAVLVLLDRKDLFDHLIDDLSRKELKIWLFIGLFMASMSVLLSVQGQSLYATATAYTFFPLLCWLVLTAARATLFSLLPVFAMAFVIFALKGWADVQLIVDIDGLIKVLLQLSSVLLLAHLVATLSLERNLLLEGFRRQAVRDHLTGLQNDRGLNAFLDRWLSKNHQDQYRLVQLEILDFDDLRLMIGFDAACEIERALSQQLNSLQCRQLSRLSAGSYVWLMSDETEISDAQLNQLYDTLNRPLTEIENNKRPIQVAIASIPFDTKLDSPVKCLTALSQAVDVARKMPRRIWKESQAVTLIEQRQALIDQFDLLKKAIDNDQLRLYAQRIQPLTTAKVSDGLMYEILIRIQNDRGDVLAPAQFLNVAKVFGYMSIVDYWVIEETFKYLSERKDRLENTARCSINLSGQTLISTGLIEHIQSCFEKYGVERHKICFEITETEVIEDESIASKVINALRAMGCKVALDDFGTGFASYEYLYRYQFDYLKIDGRFVRNMLTHPVDQVTVKSIAQVAQAMGLETVAEFVESEDMLEMLSNFGVTYAQGYGIAHPQPLNILIP